MIYAWVWLFSMFCRILGLSTQHLTLKQVYFDSHGCPWAAMPVEERKNRRMMNHPQTTIISWWMPRFVVEAWQLATSFSLIVWLR